MRAREGREPGGAAAAMRRRRDETPAETNPPGARRRWQQSYRCLRRAQPGLASRRQTRPRKEVRKYGEYESTERRGLLARRRGAGEREAEGAAGAGGGRDVDGAAQQLSQAPRDGQPQAGARALA